MEPPFADRGGGVAGGAEDGGEGVVVAEGLVELVVADIGVALVDAVEEGAAGGGADGGGAVVVAELRALSGHLVEPRE